VNLLTWLAIALLGPGVLAVFVWFLFDLRALLALPEPERPSPAREEEPPRG
jgi:hypothetical protein